MKEYPEFTDRKFSTDDIVSLNNADYSGKNFSTATKFKCDRRVKAREHLSTVCRKWRKHICVYKPRQCNTYIVYVIQIRFYALREYKRILHRILLPSNILSLRFKTI